MPFGRESKIALITGIAVVMLGAAGAYAYDHSRRTRSPRA